MTKKLLIAILTQLFFVLGLASVVYGVWLWSHPLAFVLGGTLVASIAFLIGYLEMAKDGGR
jgi:hypothetical protein